MESDYVTWIRKLFSISQTGLHYSKSFPEKERYWAIRRIANEMLETISVNAAEKFPVDLDSEFGYSTPQVIVRGIIMNNSQLLLVKEKKGNYWNVPGGYADVGYSPSAAATKEIKEEVGITAVIEKVLAIYDDIDNQAVHKYAIYFIAKSDEINCLNKEYISSETTEVGMFSFDQIDKMKLNPHFIKYWGRIKPLLKNLKIEYVTTDFD